MPATPHLILPRPASPQVGQYSSIVDLALPMHTEAGRQLKAVQEAASNIQKSSAAVATATSLAAAEAARGLAKSELQRAQPALQMCKDKVVGRSRPQSTVQRPHSLNPSHRQGAIKV